MAAQVQHRVGTGPQYWIVLIWLVSEAVRPIHTPCNPQHIASLPQASCAAAASSVPVTAAAKMTAQQ